MVKLLQINYATPVLQYVECAQKEITRHPRSPQTATAVTTTAVTAAEHSALTANLMSS